MSAGWEVAIGLGLMLAVIGLCTWAEEANLKRDFPDRNANRPEPAQKPRHIGPDYVRQPGQPGFNAMAFLGELLAESIAKDIEAGKEPTLDGALYDALDTLDELERP